jgi:hypothetical protein
MLFGKQILIQREYGVEEYERNSASETTGLAAVNDSKGTKTRPPG